MQGSAGATVANGTLVERSSLAGGRFGVDLKSTWAKRRRRGGAGRTRSNSGARARSASFCCHLPMLAPRPHSHESRAITKPRRDEALRPDVVTNQDFVRKIDSHNVKDVHDRRVPDCQ